jgi:hypothetical protein
VPETFLNQNITISSKLKVKIGDVKNKIQKGDSNTYDQLMICYIHMLFSKCMAKNGINSWQIQSCTPTGQGAENEQEERGSRIQRDTFSQVKKGGQKDR